MYFENYKESYSDIKDLYDCSNAKSLLLCEIKVIISSRSNGWGYWGEGKERRYHISYPSWIPVSSREILFWWTITVLHSVALGAYLSVVICLLRATVAVLLFSTVGAMSTVTYTRTQFWRYASPNFFSGLSGWRNWAASVLGQLYSEHTLHKRYYAWLVTV